MVPQLDRAQQAELIMFHRSRRRRREKRNSKGAPGLGGERECPEISSRVRSFSTFHHACVRTSVNCDLDLILGGLRSQRRRTNIGDDIQRERGEEVKRLTQKI